MTAHSFLRLMVFGIFFWWGASAYPENPGDLRKREMEAAIKAGRSWEILSPLIRLYRESSLRDEKHQWLLLLSQVYYKEGLWNDGLEYFRALHELSPGGLGTLRLAEYYAFHGTDRERATQMVRQLREDATWTPRDRETSSLLRRSLLFTRWDLASWGLSDTNISAMVQDQDDLWIGTWNGGLVRYSLATREVTTFRTGEYRQNLTTIRCLAVDPWFVYVGGFEGLWRYSKLTGKWQKIPAPEGFPLERIQDLAVRDRKLIVATLGAGIWELQGGLWKSWKDFGWTYDYVNKIVDTGQSFYIATMDQGAWEFIPGTQPVQLSQGFPGSFPRNITFLLKDRDEIWFGTYGQGLLRRSLSTGRWDRWNTASGTLQGDYLIAGKITPQGAVFGTLGQGLAYYSRSSEKLVLWNPASTGGPGDVGVISVLGDRIILGTLGEGLILTEEAILEAELP